MTLLRYATLLAFAVAALAAEPGRVDYNFDVRPILADNCFRCHGPDAKSRQAGLRLDQPESAWAQAIARGKPEASELIRRVDSKDPSYRMPPASMHKSLSPAEIATLREWIRQGAEYKPHWAFLPPVKAGGGDIDRFILARLQKENLKPAPEANRETLINRVSLSLTGLPPTLEEVDAFLADKRPDAYEKLVDRLLASPRYGEHMAAYWMNIARYSESDGFLDDHHDRLFWPYRDWVIDAFNRNMRFDEFAKWQIAGDLLPNATKEQKLATAFLRVGKRTSENGAIDEEYRVEYALDRANTIGGGFLALTTGCARCHDHKYDPIAQKDFYALSGFFNSADEPGFHAPGFSTVQAGPVMPWVDSATEAKIAAAREAIRVAEKSYESALKSARGRAPVSLSAEQVRKSVEASMVAWYPFETAHVPADDELPTAYTPAPIPDGLLFPFQRNQYIRKDPGTRAQEQTGGPRRLPNSMIREKLMASPAGIPGVAPAILEEANLKPGKFGNAFYFTETNRGLLGKYVGFYDRTQPYSFDLWIYAASEYENSQVINHRDDDNSGGGGYKLSIEKNHLSFYMMHSWPFNMLHVISKQQVPVKEWTHLSMTYDGSSRAAGITLYINGKPAEVEVEHDQLTESSLPRTISSVFNQFVGFEFGRRFREVTMNGGAIDEIRIFNRALTPLEVAWLHEGNNGKPGSAPAKSGIAETFAANDPEVVAAGKALYTAREAENKMVSWLPEVMIMADAPKPRQTFVLSRGLYNQRLEPVEPAPLTQVFPFDPKLPRNRLGLVSWLFDRKNPLVARVFVNRLWQLQFGTGLVETSDDFGMQGALPSHPELLDWLAVDFMESGWDIRRLNRMLVLSAAFRRASEDTPELKAKDPQNRLLARGPRYRMSAEVIRDHALAVSGLLEKKIGGPSAYPYQPEGVWVAGVTVYDYPRPDQLPPEDQHRRSLYTFVKRNTPPPSMSVFDFPERHATLSRRLTSNTPLQALVLLDDPQFVEAYRVLATKVLKARANADEQLRLIFREATRRQPRESELATLRRYYASELARFLGDPAKAAAVVKVGVTPVDATIDAAHMAALTNVTAAVMNTPDAYSVH